MLAARLHVGCEGSCWLQGFVGAGMVWVVLRALARIRPSSGSGQSLGVGLSEVQTQVTIRARARAMSMARAMIMASIMIWSHVTIRG